MEIEEYLEKFDGESMRTIFKDYDDLTNEMLYFGVKEFMVLLNSPDTNKINVISKYLYNDEVYEDEIALIDYYDTYDKNLPNEYSKESFRMDTLFGFQYYDIFITRADADAPFDEFCKSLKQNFFIIGL